MYVPRHFAEDRPEALQEQIRSAPFGTLITMTADGLEANHIPFVLKSEPAPYGSLQGHLARANSQWRSFTPTVEALVVFVGPQAYVSPSWYPSKEQTAGKVVPTWNYVVVHAYGKLRAIEEPDWLQGHLEALTRQQEHRRPDPWHLSDAPADFTAKLIQAIVGVEIQVSRLVGKWKLGQNRSPEDQTGIIQGLRAEPDAASQAMLRYLLERK